MNETTPEKLLRQERDDAILAHHLALAYIEALEKATKYQLDDKAVMRNEIDVLQARIEALEKALRRALDLDSHSATEEGHKQDMVMAIGILSAALAAKPK